MAILQLSVRSSKKAKRVMTQDERWHQQWQSIMNFMEANKRRPSKFIPEERGMRNWWKQQQKLINSGALKEERIPLFEKLLEMGENYKHVNQYQ